MTYQIYCVTVILKADACFKTYELTAKACKNGRHIWPIIKPEVDVKQNMTDRNERQQSLYQWLNKGVYMVYILNRPLFSAISKIFQRQKNNSRFYILKLYFLLHNNQFSCSVTSLLNIALQSWRILFKIRKIDVFWPNRCFLLLS